MIPRDKLIPMVVALPLFLQNVDSTILGTAVPTIAQSLQVDTLRLNLAITAYLISLGIFLPASGWIADRFGPRRVFCVAIALFSVASGLCGLANSLEMLVACRALQGMGAAMMIPVGRLILLRSIPVSAMFAAMVWFTVPPTLGRMLGPLFGGVVVTWLSWRWIFLINIPLGMLAIVLALTFIEKDDAQTATTSFDFMGFCLLGIGLATFLGALETLGSHFVPGRVSAALALFGAACLIGYVVHSRKAAEPLIYLGLIRYPTFFAAMIGGAPLRLAIGAVPLLLPLLLQLGFGLSPLASGLLTMGTAIGTLGTRFLLNHVLKRTGFRPLLLGSTVCSSLSYVVYASFTENTPQALLFMAFVASGLVMSLVTTALQALAYSEIPKPLMGHATALSTMAQQLTFSLGVLLAVELLQLSVWWRGGNPTTLVLGDFPFAFLGLAAAVLVALIFFVRLPPQVGSEFRQ